MPTLASRTKEITLVTAKQLFLDGIYPTLASIAKVAGVSEQVVLKYRKQLLGENKWPCELKEKHNCGESHFNSILTVEDVKKIKATSNEIPSAELAKHFLVSRSTIGDIRAGRTWKEV